MDEASQVQGHVSPLLEKALVAQTLAALGHWLDKASCLLKTDSDL